MRVMPNMALQRTHRPRFLKVRSGENTGRPVQEHAGTGRSLRSLGAPLNAQPLGISCRRSLASTRSVGVSVLGPAGGTSWLRKADA